MRHGGLKIIGTERHESRRIDNQLRGRSGRQGDPGESRFYIGLDDDLMKIFGGDMITKVFNTIGATEDMPIEAKIISNSVETAQKRVEGKNFAIRKNVLQYDDVMNAQREIIYKQRREVLDGVNLKDQIITMIRSIAEEIVGTHFNDNINIDALLHDVREHFNIENLNSLKEKPDQEEIVEEIQTKAISAYEEKQDKIGEENLRELERVVMLKVVDQKWMDHIDAMEELKDGIGLRAYGQKDPVVQYRIEGFDMFDQMVTDMKLDVVRILTHLQRATNTGRTQNVRVTGAALEESAISRLDSPVIPNKSAAPNRTVVNNAPKAGRNDACPCGSGKKYKNCCGN